MKALGWMLCGLMLSAPAFAQGNSGKSKDAGTAAPAQAAKKEAGEGPTAVAELRDAQGKAVGEVRFREAPKGVVVHVKVNGLPAGSHAIHIHETGQCEAPFKTAGGHYNPKHKQHGIENMKGMHAGDFPNLEIPQGGALEVELFTDAVSLKKGANSVFDKDGSAIIIHASADDYKSDPAGNAGDRIACGVIKEQ